MNKEEILLEKLEEMKTSELAEAVYNYIIQLQQENNQLKLDFELYKDNHIYKNYEVERKGIVLKELRSWLEEEKNRLARECSQIYEDSLGKTRLVNEDIFNELNNVLSKLNELEGGKNE